MSALLAGFLCAICLTVAARAGEYLVKLDSSRVDPGGEITIHLVAVNSSANPVTTGFPATVEGAVIQGETRVDVRFNRVDPIPDGGVPVAPNGFASVEYRTTMPEGVSGSARLEFALDNTPTFTVEITPSRAPANASESVTGRRFSLREAMGHESTETSFFKRHIFPYEPFYFIAGPDAPGVKFQVSIKYRLVNTEVGDDGEAEGWLYRHAHWMDGLHLAYTQRSLWDVQAESAPFLDSSYMPELLYERPNLINPEHGWLERIGAQVGFKHESNGKGGADSRSLNIGYVRVPFVFGDENNFYVSLEPRAWFYVGDLSDNPDLTDYRGYVDLRLKAGWARGLQVAGWLRSGKDFNRGSAQVDVTYPLHNLLSRSFSLYLQAQYFNGYGESLLYYNQRSEIWRVGIGLFR